MTFARSTASRPTPYRAPASTLAPAKSIASDRRQPAAGTGWNAPPLAVALLAAVAAAAPAPAHAWTPKTQETIAWEAAHLAPPDLARQLIKHRGAYFSGVLQPFDDADPARHRKSADGAGALDRSIEEAVGQAVGAIRGHRPFDEIVWRLGIVSHYTADANNPLAASNDDASAGRYFVDFLRYAETAEPRFPLVFYGVRPGLDRDPDISALVAAALARGRTLYPKIGLEYRKIDFASGLGVFDDRSTAFGVASVAWSHAVTDVVQALRFVWIRAGGADQRSGLPATGTQLLVLPRAAAPSRSAAGP
jgi:hypothetical protein